MATLASPCWYCAEYQPIIGHDSNFNLICHQCFAEVPANQANAFTTVEVEDPEVVKQAYSDYETQYLTFSSQRIELLNFYHQTKALPWRLIPGSRSGPTWSEHYQASYKTIALLEDQFKIIKTYLDLGLRTQVYPQYDLTPPGHVVKVKADDLTTKVVVNYDYFDKMTPIILKRIEAKQSYPLEDMFRGFALNPNLTLDWLLQRPEWPWSWPVLHRNPNFDLTWLEAFPDQPWNFDAICQLEEFQQSWLSRHPKLTLLAYLMGHGDSPVSHRLTISNIKLLLDTLDPDNIAYVINYEYLNRYIDFNQIPGPDGPRLVLEFLVENQLEEYKNMCLNESLDWSLVLSFHRLDMLTQRCWSNLSRRSIDADVLESFYLESLQIGRETGWNLVELSYNPSFKVIWLESPWFDFNDNNLARTWSWIGLSSNPNTTLDVIKQHPDRPWDIRELGENPNFDPSWLELLPQFNWPRACFSKANLTKFSWSRLLSKPWLGIGHNNPSWINLSGREDLTWQIIGQYPDVFQEWSWREICRNPDLAWSDDPLWTENRDKWEFEALSENPALNVARYQAYPEEDWSLYDVCRNSMILL